MDKIILPGSPEATGIGTTVYIPFEGKAVNGRIDTARFKIAKDLPPHYSREEAKAFIASNRDLATRIIDIREYTMVEAMRIEEISLYLKTWKDKRT